MDPLLTPTTALLHSYFDLSAFESPTTQHSDTLSEPDVFSYSFEAYNQQLLKTSNAPRKQEPFQLSANTFRDDVTKQYITPPGSNQSSVSGTNHCSPDSANTDHKVFELPPLPTSVLEQSPTSSTSPELQGGFSSFSGQLRPYDNCETTFNDNGLSRSYGSIDGSAALGDVLRTPFNSSSNQRRKVPQLLVQYEATAENKSSALPEKGSSRRRKRQPLGTEERALKRAKSLERNRVAASNCRERKRLRIQMLEEQYKDLEQRNTELKDMKRDLIAEVQALKEKLGVEVSDGEISESIAGLSSVVHDDQDSQADSRLQNGIGIDKGNVLRVS